MGEPEKRREADELVEPLFAGLAGAEEQSEDSLELEAEAEGPKNPWNHPRSAILPGQAVSTADVEREPAMFPLVLKALILMVALVAIGAFIYVTFGA
ncbi:MAG TPA: hypothetical protein VK843_20525 [Planctomycetota bacterium]|nr:hypothetical protein [Planctomycetota bacterium]